MADLDSFGVGFRLLIVDDTESVRDFLGEVLSKCGFAVDVAEDLRRARELVDARSYDLYVLDKNLPDGSGLELARYLNGRQADCEIVLVTAHGSSESAFEAFELGLAELITKPFDDLDDLRRRIKKALARLIDARRARSSRILPPPAPASTDSQRRLRFFVEMRLRFILVDGSLTGPAFVSQLSHADLFVETDRPLPLGNSVRLRLYMPGRSAMDLRGLVRRHGEGTTMLGMRIEFTDLSEAAVANISNYLAPLRSSFDTASPRQTFSFVPSPLFAETLSSAAQPAEVPTLGDRFTPDALRLFVSMYGGKVLDFLDTLDTATVKALLDVERRPVSSLRPSPPGKTPASFEDLPHALFDPENVDAETLPTDVGSVSSQPTEPANEEERLRAKYGFAEDLLDETLRRKYNLDDALFDDEPPEPDRKSGPTRGRELQAPAGDSVLSRIGASPDQRRAFAEELRRRGEDALGRGLVLKAASDLGLALAFDEENVELKALADRVRSQANAARAEDLYRQGLQQVALGDPSAATKLLLGACELVQETKYQIAAARVLLQSGRTESVRECRLLLKDALARDGNSPDLHVLHGRAAELEGFPKVAVRSYKRALELKPDHEAAKQFLARLE